MNEGILRVLTVRQPWAGAIAHLGKDVENRPQRWAYRGPVLIHAGVAAPRVEDRIDVCILGGCTGQRCTEVSEPRGQIIAIAEIVDCVEASDSPWWIGPYGYVLRHTRPLTPTPYTGGLGLRKYHYGASMEDRTALLDDEIAEWFAAHGYDGGDFRADLTCHWRRWV